MPSTTPTARIGGSEPSPHRADSARIKWSTIGQVARLVTFAPIPIFPDMFILFAILVVIALYMIGGYYLLLVPGSLYNSLVSENWAQFVTVITRFFLMATAVLSLRVLRNVLREMASNHLRQRLTLKLHLYYFGSPSDRYVHSIASLSSLTSQSSSSALSQERDHDVGTTSDREDVRDIRASDLRNRRHAEQNITPYTPPRYYKIVHGKAVDNPDQRVVSDTREFCNSFFTVLVGDSKGFLEATVSIIFYTYATYSRTGWFGVLAGWIWSAGAGALSLAAVNHASPMLFAQERLEATLRYAHARVRRHAEEIAFLRGGMWERGAVDSHLGRAVQNQWKVIGRHAWLNTLQNGFSYYVSIIMYVSLAFAVRARVFHSTGSASSDGLSDGYPIHGTPGEKAQWISQAGSVFMQLLFAFTMLVNLSTDVSVLVANVERLSTLIEQLTDDRKLSTSDTSVCSHPTEHDSNARLHDTIMSSSEVHGVDDTQPLISTDEKDDNNGVPGNNNNVSLFFTDESHIHANDGNISHASSPSFSGSSFISLQDVYVRLDDDSSRGSERSNGFDADSTHAHARLVGPITLHVSPGKIVHLRGATGSGKTSILRVIRGLRAPVSGLCERRGGGIAFIPQGAYIPVDATTLRQLVVYPHAVTMSSAECEDVLHVLRRVGWQDPVADVDQIREWATILSPGQAQLIAAARVLCGAGRGREKTKGIYVAVMDEATAALDEKAEVRVIAAFREAGIGMLFVGHSRAMDGVEDVQAVDISSG